MSELIFESTRASSAAVSLSDAIRQGLAPDGGLYVPRSMPSSYAPAEEDLATEAHRFLTPWFVGDPLAEHLEDICKEAFDFPCPLVAMGTDSRLELFHGPTAAFKDFGARFLAACTRRLRGPEARTTVLVATSGDTGGAVAAAFAEAEGVDVWILYPEGRVSERQEAQLCSWGHRVRAFSVEGSFDDCQSIVKLAFGSKSLHSSLGLTSANSINLARILPQAAYHAYAAAQHQLRFGRSYRPVIPTGNLGHGVAALWARACGAPVGEIVLALNRNRACLDWLETGTAEPRVAHATVANAMDVGVPSNLERLVHLHPRPSDAPIRAFSFEDGSIRTMIQGAPERYGFVPCPHTACALLAREQLDAGPVTVVATAHPAKFDSIVEPLVGPVPLPSALREVLERPRSRTRIQPSLDALLDAAGQRDQTA